MKRTREEDHTDPTEPTEKKQTEDAAESETPLVKDARLFFEGNPYWGATVDEKGVSVTLEPLATDLNDKCLRREGCYRLSHTIFVDDGDQLQLPLEQRHTIALQKTPAKKIVVDMPAHTDPNSRAAIAARINFGRQVVGLLNYHKKEYLFETCATRLPTVTPNQTCDRPKQWAITIAGIVYYFLRETATFAEMCAVLELYAQHLACDSARVRAEMEDVYVAFLENDTTPNLLYPRAPPAWDGPQYSSYAVAHIVHRLSSRGELEITEDFLRRVTLELWDDERWAECIQTNAGNHLLNFFTGAATHLRNGSANARAIKHQFEERLTELKNTCVSKLGYQSMLYKDFNRLFLATYDELANIFFYFAFVEHMRTFLRYDLSSCELIDRERLRLQTPTTEDSYHTLFKLTDRPPSTAILKVHELKRQRGWRLEEWPLELEGYLLGYVDGCSIADNESFGLAFAHACVANQVFTQAYWLKYQPVPADHAFFGNRLFSTDASACFDLLSNRSHAHTVTSEDHLAFVASYLRGLVFAYEKRTGMSFPCVSVDNLFKIGQRSLTAEELYASEHRGSYLYFLEYIKLLGQQGSNLRRCEGHSPRSLYMCDPTFRMDWCALSTRTYPLALFQSKQAVAMLNTLEQLHQRLENAGLSARYPVFLGNVKTLCADTVRKVQLCASDISDLLHFDGLDTIFGANTLESHVHCLSNTVDECVDLCEALLLFKGEQAGSDYFDYMMENDRDRVACYASIERVKEHFEHYRTLVEVLGLIRPNIDPNARVSKAKNPLLFKTQNERNYAMRLICAIKNITPLRTVATSYSDLETIVKSSTKTDIKRALLTVNLATEFNDITATLNRIMASFYTCSRYTAYVSRPQAFGNEMEIYEFIKSGRRLPALAVTREGADLRLAVEYSILTSLLYTAPELGRLPRIREALFEILD